LAAGKLADGVVGLFLRLVEILDDVAQEVFERRAFGGLGAGDKGWPWRASTPWSGRLASVGSDGLRLRLSASLPDETSLTPSESRYMESRIADVF